MVLITVFAQCQIFAPAYVSSNCCLDNQIQVSGSGVASGQPDVAVISIRFQEKALTSAEAVKALSAKVSAALAIFTQNGINGSSYETGSVNVYPEYSYVSGRSEIVGQTASQSLTARVHQLDAKGEKVAKFIDSLAVVNGINIDSVSFDINDKTKLQTDARSAAFKDAKTKAEDYAAAAGLRVTRILKIEDESLVSSPPIMQKMEMASLASDSVSSSTSVPVGELEVSYQTTLTFAVL